MKLLTPQVINTLIFFFGIAVLFFTFAQRIKRNSSSNKTTLTNYLKEDQEANFITKKAPPKELIIQPNIAELPQPTTPKTRELWKRIQHLSTKPMARLDGYTNLQLKQKFGINHLETIFTYEQQYQSYLKTLLDYGIAFHDEGDFTESCIILNNCLDFGCDLNKCYLYLVKNYGIIKDKESLITLKKYLKEQPPLGKEMIEAHIDEALNLLNNQ